MRLFVALNFTKQERQRVHRAARPLRDAELPIRWIDPETFHLTLKFLGSVDPRTLESIVEVVDRVAGATKRFDMSLGGFGAFPTIRKPRVIWVGADPSPALRCLKQDLEWALAELSFERETRAFHPHVTIGRAGGEEGAGVFRGLDDLASGIDFRASVPLKWVDLMRSDLSKSGPRYTLVHRAELKRT